jgi:hypothetical protein
VSDKRIRDEFVRERATGRRWKVTARFNLGLAAGAFIPCVRIRSCYHSVSVVEHFSTERFEKLFEPWNEKSPATPKRHGA